MFTHIIKTKYVKCISFLMIVFFPFLSFAQVMQSSSYKIEFDSVNTAGVLSVSSNYTIEDTTGEIATGEPNSAAYNLKAGYQQEIITVAVGSTTSPSPTPSTSSGGGGHPDLIGSFEITDIKIVPTLDSAIITWTTNKPATSKLSWGKTKKYELGVLSESINKTNHLVRIENLSQETQYFFKIDLVDSFGKEISLLGQEFLTFSAPEKQPFLNVSNLQINIEDNQVLINWENSSDFESVRVLRSSLFYPNNPTNGDIIYEGSGDKIFDKIPKAGETYYYTVFSKDRNGNYSSGVIINVTTPVIKDSAVDSPVVVVPSDPFEDLPISTEVYPDLEKLTLLDFDFIQNGNRISFDGSTIDIKSEENLKISVDYDKLPEVLKTIGITLKDPEDESKVFSFILRVNKDKTAYEAVIAPLGNSGEYSMGVSVIDFKNQMAKKIEGELSVADVVVPIEVLEMFNGRGTTSLIVLFALILLIMIVRKFWIS